MRLSNPTEEYINRIKSGMVSTPPTARKLSATFAEIEKNRVDFLDAKGMPQDGVGGAGKVWDFAVSMGLFVVLD